MALGKPALPGSGAPLEAKVRSEVLEYCRTQGWIVFNGTTVRATGRTIGEPDLTVVADLGSVYFVELKSRTGKLRPEQAAIGAWLSKLGHKWLVIRSLSEFIEQTQIQEP